TFEVNDQLLPEFSPVNTSTNSSDSTSSIGPVGGSEVKTARNTTESALAVRPLQPSPQATDPAANLSFNLNLTDKQRRDKAGVALPYLEARVADVSGGEIVYQLDDEDDWDEDDPDDDLEI
ncbi:Elongator complex protein, partial [Coemansia furcata]